MGPLEGHDLLRDEADGTVVHQPRLGLSGRGAAGIGSTRWGSRRQTGDGASCCYLKDDHDRADMAGMGAAGHGR